MATKPATTDPNETPLDGTTGKASEQQRTLQ